MIKKNTRGFTLIELLVVIAIIGILASVVLASLNSARDKGADAAVKSNLNNARAEAELFYDNNGRSYDGVCAASGANVIGDNMQGAANSMGGTYTVSDTANGSATTVVCHDYNSGGTNGWAAIGGLRSSATLGWCVDSTGYSSTTLLTALDTDNDVTCL